MKIPWIEDLREEGHPHHVLDELLARLVGAGLGTWKGQDGQMVDPRGPGRQICLDLKNDTLAVVEEVRERLLNEAKHRILPVARIREIATDVRASAEQAERRARGRAKLVNVPVQPAETVQFLDALHRIASPDHIRAWFDPCGVVAIGHRKGGTLVTVVTPHLPQIVAKHVDSLAAAAARIVWGASADIEFVRGRACPASKPGRAA